MCVRDLYGLVLECKYFAGYAGMMQDAKDGLA